MALASDQLDDESRTTAVGLYNYAEAYLKCAHQLAHARPDRLRFNAPIEFLFYHSVELYLKAFLRSCGLSLKQLKKLGHNLRAIKAAAAARGLALPRYPDTFFNFLDPDRLMGTRYLKTGFVRKPALETIEGIASQVRDTVRKALIDRDEPLR